MVTFIKKRLLNGTPPASTTFSHFRQDTKEEISHPKLWNPTPGWSRCNGRRYLKRISPIELGEDELKVCKQERERQNCNLVTLFFFWCILVKLFRALIIQVLNLELRVRRYSSNAIIISVIVWRICLFLCTARLLDNWTLPLQNSLYRTQSHILGSYMTLFFFCWKLHDSFYFTFKIILYRILSYILGLILALIINMLDLLAFFVACYCRHFLIYFTQLASLSSLEPKRNEGKPPLKSNQGGLKSPLKYHTNRNKTHK